MGHVPLTPPAVILLAVWVLIMGVALAAPLWVLVASVVVAVAVIVCAVVDIAQRGDRVPK